MPSTLIDVPLNGDGVPVNLGEYGFAKTFTAQGSDQFDALVMVQGVDGMTPVGRLKGQSTEIIEAWGEFFMLRRIDDGVNTGVVTVSVDAKINQGLITLNDANLVNVNDVIEVNVSALDEPMTVVCTSPGNNPSAVVEVYNKTSTGVEAPIGRISPGAKLTVDGSIDVTILGFRYVTGNPDAGGVSCRILACTPQNNSPIWAAGVFTPGDPGNVTYQSNRTPGRLIGVTRLGVGTYLVSFTYPPSTEVHATVSPHSAGAGAYRFNAVQNGLSFNEQIVSVRDALTGVLTDIGDACFIEVWSPLAL